jgi:hypothetical protein
VDADFPDIAHFGKPRLPHRIKTAAHLVNESRQVVNLLLEIFVCAEFPGHASIRAGAWNRSFVATGVIGAHSLLGNSGQLRIATPANCAEHLAEGLPSHFRIVAQKATTPILRGKSVPISRHYCLGRIRPLHASVAITLGGAEQGR